ncbi:MAG: hypothetical protein Q7S03_02075 [bacterium]|nr:hypothetical protein [bacterium]
MKKFTALFFFLVFYLFFFQTNAKADDFTSTLTCNPSDNGDNSSRPIECAACNKTNSFCSACATTTTVSQPFTYAKGDGSADAPHCIQTTWGGTVNLDPTKVTVPFVGKKGQEDENKYLADYFEGTNEYYREYKNTFGPLTFYGIDPMYLTNYDGIIRKLTPMQYQDQLKEGMVQRAQTSLASGNILQEGKIHDYKLQYVGRLCWDAPIWADVLAALVNRLGNIPVNQVTHYCVYEQDAAQQPFVQGLRTLLDHSPIAIDHQYFGGVGMQLYPWDRDSYKLTDLTNHFPPDSKDPDYAKKWEAWKISDGGKWFQLWQATPLFTREDTPGQILPYLGYRPKDTPQTISNQVEQVPHVARLYEASKLTTQILFPYGTPRGTSQRVIRTISSTPTEGSCGLAGPIPVQACTQTAITDSNPNDSLCCKSINFSFTAVDAFENPDYESCHAAGIQCSPNPDPDCIPTIYNNYCQICTDPCSETNTITLQRKIGVNIDHPYLADIWEQTANAQTDGVMNSFRPNEVSKFQDIDASSLINNSYQSRSSGGSIDPTNGQFYFNSLGGVEMSKEWLVKALTPYK